MAYPQHVFYILVFKGYVFSEPRMDEDVVIRFVAGEKGIEEVHVIVRHIEFSQPMDLTVSVRGDRSISAVGQIQVLVFIKAYIIEKHLFMISLQTDNLTYLFLEIKHEIHHTPGIGSPVYIISNEYEGIVLLLIPILEMILSNLERQP